MKSFIHFKNISFGYENHNKIFDNFNLEIARGEKVGIVGTSGAGKSTLINLLLKNFAINNYKYWNRPSALGPKVDDKQCNEIENNKINSSEEVDYDDGGDILINNQSIYDVSRESLSKCIGLIPQDTMMFHRSIAENISYGKPNVNMSEVEKAAKFANIHEFIESLPDKYETLVGERGIKLSGGQRQRIAIARAILKNAPILILDEATSALDTQTEREIQKSMSKILAENNTTVIAVAHRLSTIKHLDRIIVIENGKIVESGTLNQLLEISNGKFKSMWNNQIDGILA